MANPVSKKAVEHEYTPARVRELLRCAQDASYFIGKYIQIQHPLKGMIPFDLYSYQVNMLRTMQENRKTIVLSARQTGKCSLSSTTIRVVDFAPILKSRVRLPALRLINKPLHDKILHSTTPTTISNPPKQNKLRTILTNWILKPTITTIGDIYTSTKMHPVKIYDGDDIKFIEKGTPQILVDTPTGWEVASDILKTVPYAVWSVILQNGLSIQCADTHILITADGQELFVKDCVPGETQIQTKHGPSTVRSVKELDIIDNMYDLTIVVDHHTYYTNNILSHNSQTSAAYLLWYALFHEDKTILIASNKNSNALEMISRIRYMYETIPDWLKSGITTDGWNKLSVGFANKSRIISTATSESSGRGLSISLLFCDELAFVSRTVQEEFWKSISPTLSTGGGCIISSTPNGEGDLYANLWHGAELGTNGFAPIFVAWNEPPDRDETFKQEKISELGAHAWRQEFECEFLTSESLLVDALLLNNMSAIIKAIVPVKEDRGITWYENLIEGATYLMGVDPSSGSGKDYSVIQVFSFPELVQVAEFRSNVSSSPQLYSTMKYILRHMEKISATCYFSVENNGVGEGVIALYQNDENPPDTAQFISEEGRTRLGMTTTNRSKLRACLNLKTMIESGKFIFKSTLLLKELKTYAAGKGSYEALPGATDDLVAACLIVIRLLSEISTYEQLAFDSLYSYPEDVVQNDDDNGQHEEPLAVLF